jgi:leucoanthocyanidin reductase
MIHAAYFVAGTDIGKFTMKTVDDVRTINKSVHFRPSNNFYNMNELASLWEKKIGRTLPRVTVTEHDLLAIAAGLSSNFLFLNFHDLISIYIFNFKYYK